MAPPQQAPIAAPDGRVAPLPVTTITVEQGNYATAPQIVKVARLIAALTALGGVAFLSAHLASGDDLFLWSGLFFLAMGSWLAVGHTRGHSVAWSGQILLSVLGLLAFPLGTLMHGYVLSLWFSPEVKVWYGRY